MDNLVKNLHQYNKNLNLIIKKGKDKTELIITANGNPYHCKEVERLTYRSLKVKNWKITAFLQPVKSTLQFEMGIDQPFHFDNIRLKISEIYYNPIKQHNNSSKWGIKVYLKSYIFHKIVPQ